MWKDKKIYLVGAGKSGLDAASWLMEQGAVLCMNDRKALDAFDEDTKQSLADLVQGGAELDMGSKPKPVEWGAELVLTSPGVPLSLEEIQGAIAAGIPVTNEIELGWQISGAQIVGVTGSNGKTTVTSMIGQMMQDGGLAPFVGGNIGIPFIRQAPQMTSADWALLELSSFQLAGIRSLAPKIAIFLNLSQDHLDWHPTYEDYIASKWKISSYQGQDDWLILNEDDPLLRAEGHRRIEEGEAYLPGNTPLDGPKLLWFSIREQVSAGLYVKPLADGEIWVVYQPEAGSTSQPIPIMPIREMQLPGKHNLSNLLAALGAGMALGIPAEQLRRSAGQFQAIEHRMEVVGEYEGVLYVNDSKATNPDSAVRAMESYQRPILLIAGGDGKGLSFQEVADMLVEKGKAAILLGRDKDLLREALMEKGFHAIYDVSSMEEAVNMSASLAVPGDLVLLSPACSSLDMYSSYEERGRVFKHAVLSTYGE